MTILVTVTRLMRERLEEADAEAKRIEARLRLSGPRERAYFYIPIGPAERELAWSATSAGEIPSGGTQTGWRRESPSPPLLLFSPTPSGRPWAADSAASRALKDLKIARTLLDETVTQIVSVLEASPIPLSIKSLYEKVRDASIDGTRKPRARNGMFPGPHFVLALMKLAAADMLVWNDSTGSLLLSPFGHSVFGGGHARLAGSPDTFHRHREQ